MSKSASKSVCLVCASILFAAPQLKAQALSDPTQPPAAAFVAPGGSVALPAVSALPHVQSILISTRQGGRQLAVINGQTVRIGDSFGGAVLTRLTPTTAVLRRGTQLQTLRLYPASAPRVANGASR